MGLPQPTVYRYLDLLEVSHQLVRVPTYAVNRTKRLVKTPKIYWSDTGLALFLAGESEPRGAHLENLVLSDLAAWRSSELDAPQILYWRTSTGSEVDFVIEYEPRRTNEKGPRRAPVYALPGGDYFSVMPSMQKSVTVMAELVDEICSDTLSMLATLPLKALPVLPQHSVANLVRSRTSPLLTPSTQ